MPRISTKTSVPAVPSPRPRLESSELPHDDFIYSAEFEELSEDDIEQAFDEERLRDAVAGGGKSPLVAAGKSPYLLRLSETKLLSPLEEKTLFRRMNFARYRASCLSRSLARAKPGGPLYRRIDRLRTIAVEDRNRLVRANVRLVMSIAKKFANPQFPFEDLLSEGISTLLRAVEKFDYSRGFRFSTYATLAVRRTLYRMQEHGRTERLRFQSLSAAESVAMESEIDDDTLTESRWLRLQSSVKKLLNRLDARERTIIRRRFGLDPSGEAATLQSIAREFGVCKERVRQLEQRALAKLQSMATAGGMTT